MASFKLNNGFDMPAVGLGTWQAPVGQVGSAVRAAIQAGYRHIDCAFIYMNEGEIGEALADMIRQGVVRREDLFITTKLWNTMHHVDDIKPALQDQLSKLQLHYVDLYLMHSPVAFKRGPDVFPKDEAGNVMYDETHYIDTWKGMEHCVDEGLARSIGLSNFNSQQIQDVIDKSRIKPVVLQVEIHPFFQQHKLIDFCQQRDIVVTAYSSLISPQRGTSAMPKIPSVFTEPTLASIGAKYNKSPAQVVLRWLYQRKVITIPKSVTPERIQQNIQIFDFELKEEDMDTIKGLDMNTRCMAFYVERDGKLEMRDKHAPNFPFNIDF